MSETKWSPEPWKWFEEPSADVDAIQDANGNGVVNWHEIVEDDARRIVACVNACAGIPTEALEAGRLGEALTLLGGILDDADRKAAHGNYGMANALPRDPLVAALRALGRLP